jgi:beta-lactamase class A
MGQRINDRIPVRLPKGTSIAHKTGLERSVCHDIGLVFTERGDFLICVLTRHKAGAARAAKNFIARVALLAYNFETAN